RKLPRKLYRSNLSHNRDFYLAWVIELLFDGFRDVPANLDGIAVIHPGCIRDDADLPASLNGIGVLHAGETAGDGFQFLQPLDILLERFTASAGPGSADGIRRRDENGIDVIDGHIVMMTNDRMEHVLVRLTIPPCQFSANLGMAAFHFV